MDNINLGKKPHINFVREALLKFSLVLFAGVVISVIIHDKFIIHLDVYHTILELICIFIAISVFISVWFTHERSSMSNYVLGFGYLVVASFDILHTFYHLKLNLSAQSYFDLSTRFWMLGRLTEAATIFLSIKLTHTKCSKWVKLFITVLVVLSCARLVITYHDILPVLLTDKGVTPVKVALEYVVILIYIISMYMMRDKLNEKSVITYKYIFMALMFGIASEICFTIYTTVVSIYWTMGHIFKIITYYYIFKGIFLSSIVYPYDQLEEERKRLNSANNELTVVTETLNDVLDALPIGVHTYGEDGKIKYVNKKLEELLGCESDLIQGITPEQFLRMFPKDEIDEKNLLEAMAQDKKEIINTIRTYRNFKGNKVKISISAKKIRKGILILCSDAKKDQELRNLHIQTETILNSVSNGILMIDINRKIIMCNTAMEAIYERHRNELIGMDIEELNRLTEFDSEELPNLALSGQGDKQFYDVSLKSFKSNKRDLLSYLATIRNVDGEIIGAISVNNDVTEIKKSQQKMMQQEKLALLGQMGAAIVHETRNYLTTIKGRSQLISMLAVNPDVKKYAEKIDSDVSEVNRIISEFLFLSKPRETELKEISMADIFDSLRSIVNSTSLMKGVNVDIKLSKEERYLLCDETQLKQVILNLCKNAVDAMIDNKEARLEIKTGYEVDSNEMYISIEDNGKGITEEDLKKIGTPFFTTKELGTGLGLSVCYKIIEEHKGRIEVKSKPNVGTNFTVFLPCLEDEDEDEEIVTSNMLIFTS